MERSKSNHSVALLIHAFLGDAGSPAFPVHLLFHSHRKLTGQVEFFDPFGGGHHLPDEARKGELQKEDPHAGQNDHVDRGRSAARHNIVELEPASS